MSSLTNSSEINTKTSKADLIALVQYLENELGDSCKIGSERLQEISRLKTAALSSNEQLRQADQKLQSLSNDFVFVFKNQLLAASHPVHPTKRIGHFKLRRTTFPKDGSHTYDTMKACIDPEWHLEFSVLAQRLGYTTDELMRRSAFVLVNLFKGVS